MFYVYFLRSSVNHKIYTGFTEKDPNDRLRDHLLGSNTWTRQNSPFELLYYEAYRCKQDAMARERFYKSGFGRTVRDAIMSAVSARGGPALGGG